MLAWPLALVGSFVRASCSGRASPILLPRSPNTVAGVDYINIRSLLNIRLLVLQSLQNEH